MKKEILKYAKGFENVKYDYVNATIYHYPHGYVQDRQYISRKDILNNNDFDPSKDIFYNSEGVIEFSDKWANKASAQIQEFFRLRKEDELKISDCAWRDK